MDSMDLLVTIPNNPLLANLPAIGNNGVLLNVMSTITTVTPETTTTNNFDIDQIIVQMPLSTIAGNVYVDVFQDQQFTPAQDISLGNVTVCLNGITFNGSTVGATGDLVMPCTTTDAIGNYSFV